VTANLSLAVAHRAKPAARIDLLRRFHEPHRQQLTRFMSLAVTVEAVHADHAAEPHVLKALPASMHAELVQHMEEEAAIPLSMLGRDGMLFVVHPIGVTRAEHQVHAE
jgi:regulator of cell morphogenesis and NO signaling